MTLGRLSSEHILEPKVVFSGFYDTFNLLILTRLAVFIYLFAA